MRGGIQETRRFYTMDTATARAARLESGGLRAEGVPRASTLGGRGIPGPAVVVYPEGLSRIDIVVDGEIQAIAQNAMQRVYWHAR